MSHIKSLVIKIGLFLPIRTRYKLVNTRIGRKVKRVLISQYRAGGHLQSDLASRIWLLEQLVDSLHEQVIELSHKADRTK